MSDPPIDEHEPTPEWTLPPGDYAAGIESCIRTIENAQPGKQARVFELMASEAFRYAARGFITFPAVTDKLRGAAKQNGLVAELGEDEFQSRLADALAAANPPMQAIDEPPPPTGRGDYGEPAGLDSGATNYSPAGSSTTRPAIPARRSAKLRPASPPVS